MTYSRGPYSTFTSLPVPPRPEVHSSRKINFPTKLYEIEASTGGFESMPSVAQRVLMLVSFNVPPSKFVTPVDNEQVRQRIITALAPLTESKPPAIEIDEIEVGTDSAGTGFRRIKYKDLLAGTGVDQTVQLT